MDRGRFLTKSGDETDRQRIERRMSVLGKYACESGRASHNLKKLINILIGDELPYSQLSK